MNCSKPASDGCFQFSNPMLITTNEKKKLNNGTIYISLYR